MDRPETIWVGTFPYTVTYDKAAMDNIYVIKRAHLLGNSDHHALKLTIDDSIAEQVVRDTLLHEVLHAVWATSGLIEMTDLTEEQIISAIAPQLVYVFRSNPDLVTYLTTTGEDNE